MCDGQQLPVLRGGCGAGHSLGRALQGARAGAARERPHRPSPNTWPSPLALVPLQTFNPIAYLGLGGTALDLATGYYKCVGEREALESYQAAKAAFGTVDTLGQQHQQRQEGDKFE